MHGSMSFAETVNCNASSKLNLFLYVLCGRMGALYLVFVWMKGGTLHLVFMWKKALHLVPIWDKGRTSPVYLFFSARMTRFHAKLTSLSTLSSICAILVFSFIFTPLGFI